MDENQIDKIYFEISPDTSSWEEVGAIEHLQDSSDEEAEIVTMTSALLQVTGSGSKETAKKKSKVVVGQRRTRAGTRNADESSCCFCYANSFI